MRPFSGLIYGRFLFLDNCFTFNESMRNNESCAVNVLASYKACKFIHCLLTEFRCLDIECR